MKKIYDRYFDAIFIERDTWVFFGAILLLSLTLTLWSQPYTWTEYVGNITKLTLSYFPVLWFNWNKKLLRKRLSRTVFLLSWSLAHIAYPLIFALCQEVYGFFQVTDMPDLILVASVMQFFLALALEANVFLGKKIKTMRWLQKLGLEKSILLALGLISMFAGLGAVVDANLSVPFDDGGPLEVLNFFFYFTHFIRFAGQLFFCFASLYFFYFVNHYVLIPKFLQKRGILIYGASLVGTVILFYPFFAQVISWFPLNNIGWDLLPGENNTGFDELNGLVPFMVMIISMPVIIAIQWHKQSNQIVSLEKQQTVTELSLLKQQVNPHFFFNTLNNLYALSLKKSEQTPEVIMQLADLMRYVIYKGKETKVPIKGEVQYLQDYIQLQKIRLYKKLDLRFTTNIEDDDLLLPPLLFIILIENAFKHGIEPAENQAYLHIDLRQHGTQLVFSCENSVEEQSAKKPGIGLENLKRRLDLLFPEQHLLTIDQQHHYFRVELSLTLTNVSQQLPLVLSG